MTASHSGSVTGRLNASITPVTAAERSCTVLSRLRSLQQSSSQQTADTAHTAVSSSARSPNTHTAKPSAGQSAMSTWSIIPDVEAVLRICGDGETVSFRVLSKLKKSIIYLRVRVFTGKYSINNLHSVYECLRPCGFVCLQSRSFIESCCAYRCCVTDRARVPHSLSCCTPCRRRCRS